MQLDRIHIGFIGAGAMGGSIAQGLLERGVLTPAQLSICDPDAARLQAFEAQGAHCFADAADMLASELDTVLLAVKPQILPHVVAPLAKLCAGCLVISIAAGVSLASLEELLPEARVVRVMPNLPIACGSGAAAVAASHTASAEDCALVVELFSALGTAQAMREDQLDVAGTLSGCGPAYFALFADQLASTAVRLGLPAAAARELALFTMRGTAEQLLCSGDHPRSYIERVTSPGGTTAAALAQMEPLTLEAASRALEAALTRTAELAKGSDNA